MKKNYLYSYIIIFLSIVLAISPQVVNSFSFVVDDYKKTELEGVIKLTTNLSNKIVKLDCHSFLFGLSFDNHFFFLYETECYDIFSFLTRAKKNKRQTCITLYDGENPRYLLSHEISSCRKK